MAEMKLKVVEALQDDAYKGIARIDSETMRAIGVNRGDVITVKGKRETVVIVDRAYPTDVGEGIIRIDGIIRKNAKVSIGDTVSIGKTEVKDAKKVVIAPAQKGVRVQGDSDSLRQGLLGRIVLKGDIVVLGGVQRRKSLMSEDLGSLFGEFSDIFNEAGFGNFGGGLTQLKFIVVSTNPNTLPVVLRENTEVILNPEGVGEMDERVVPDINYEDIGGLNEEIKKIREMVELPLKHPEIFDRLGIEPPRGILLYGPPGTGKTLLAKAVANESEANFILINGPEIFSKFYGDSEKRIREIFEEAGKNAPSIVFFDELDAIAPSRDNNILSGEVERRVVSQLLTEMDGLKSRGRVVVIGATNRPDTLDIALRRPGRFDRELEINVPDKEGRLSILKIHTRNMPLTKDVSLDEFASITHGFVGADIAALCKEAAMHVLRKVLPELQMKDEQEIPQEILKKLIVTNNDFREALKFVQPSALREVFVEKPNVGWGDIGGLEKVKADLIEAVEWPLKHPESFKRLGIRPPRGILIYGPPGTGKTLLAKAVAKESEANFIQVDGPELQKEGIVGKDTERLRKMFKRAKQVSPCVIFFDELDSFARKRGMSIGSINDSNEGLLNTLLTEMDGLEELKEVVVIAATNRPDMLDPALLRPGRFDRIVQTTVPDKQGRLTIFKIHTKNMPIAKDVDLTKIAEKTENYTGADIEAIVREAAMIALRDDIKAKEVNKKHFDDAMKKVMPSVKQEDLKRYKDVETNYLKSARAALDMPKEKAEYLG